MRRNVTIVLAWVAATLVALGAASAAVRVVADQVATDLPPPLPADLRPTATSGEVVAAAPSPTATGPRRPAPTAAPVPTSVPSAAPQPGVPNPADSPVATASPTPEGKPAPAPSAETRTVHVVGGSTALRFESGTVTIVWATPNAGFTVAVEGSGTAEARVRFRSEDHRSEVKGGYEDGRIDLEVDEDDDRSGSGGGSDDDSEND